MNSFIGVLALKSDYNYKILFSTFIFWETIQIEYHNGYVKLHLQTHSLPLSRYI